ncbi:MAG: transcriptional regulator GcvA [Sulfuriferula multivorans]|uniref:Transcriptional regulator GcvA n=1 Tax=Sulfuriferula multivorans TaxID=1559896 RepID=A0A7C9NSX2_9PROT|nr:transcriptional regulator GcvA [Sulfuriferula multivorans]
MANLLINLNTLRAFEATARKNSFTLAAQELCVTQAAVSHQVRQIEEMLGVRLFERAHRRVTLTDAGTRVYGTISSAFRDIDSTLREVRAQGEAKATLTVQVTPSFGSRWLARRLHWFWAEYPEIDLRIYHALPHEQYDMRRVDLAIKWGHKNWGSLHSEVLFECQLLPVCSPKYLRPEHPLQKPEDLLHYALLHEDSYEDWSAWFRAAGVSQPISMRGPIIDDSNTLIEAALNLQGIALGRLPLIREQLQQGVLVSPFDLAIKCEGAYHLVYDEKISNSEIFKKFRNFLIEQAHAQAS